MKTIFTYIFLVGAFLAPMKAFSMNFQDIEFTEQDEINGYKVVLIEDDANEDQDDENQKGTVPSNIGKSGSQNQGLNGLNPSDSAGGSNGGFSGTPGQKAKFLFNKAIEVAIQAAPYALTAAKVVVAGAAIVAGVKLGGPLLSVGLYAGLGMLGVPTEAIMLVGLLPNFIDTSTVVNVATNVASKVLPMLPSFVSNAVPYFSSWFGNSAVTETVKAVAQELPKVGKELLTMTMTH